MNALPISKMKEEFLSRPFAVQQSNASKPLYTYTFMFRDRRIERIASVWQEIDRIAKYPDESDEFLSEAVIRMAKQIVRALPENHLFRLSDDNIISTEHGTIMMEWREGKNGEFVVSLDIGREYATFFAKLPNDEIVLNPRVVVEGGKLPNNVLEALSSLYRSNGTHTATAH